MSAPIQIMASYFLLCAIFIAPSGISNDARNPGHFNALFGGSVALYGIYRAVQQLACYELVEPAGDYTELHAFAIS